jgi:glycolate oxidase iron-sulfur subunit
VAATKQEIDDRKMDTVRETGADVLATGCPGCQVQLTDNALRHKLPIKVMHIMDVLE